MAMIVSIRIVLALYVLGGAQLGNARYHGNYHCTNGRDVNLHLFEWKWTDIASECENFLAQAGFCGVQVSPPSEHIIVTDPLYPWWQRYQVASYAMTSRSGTWAQFTDMVARCNNVGVRIYVDAVFNHMTGGGSGVGTAGNPWDGNNFGYVDYALSDFNHAGAECPTTGDIIDWSSEIQVRNCELLGLRDLKLQQASTRTRVIQYLNQLVDAGVAGFRVDAAKHMWPFDLGLVYDSLNTLPLTWFPFNTPPFVYQEVIHSDTGSQGWIPQYTPLGRVTEFRFSENLGVVIRKWENEKLAYLRNFGEAWGFMNALDAISFVDNHDNHRGHGGGGAAILTYKTPRMYKIAQAFTLAWQYGYVRVLSNYEWLFDWEGPPSDAFGNTNDVTCFSGGWVCEHRWREIKNMVKFHNAAVGEPILNWWDNGNNQIAFGRGNKGFIAINNEDSGVMDVWLDTGLPAGEYCDVVTCDGLNAPSCGGNAECRGTITVFADGMANFFIDSADNNPFKAIHV